jgi:hypothetical protein
MGIVLLRALPNQRTCKFLLDWYNERSYECVFHKPSVIAVANSIWETFGKEMREPRRKEDLEMISMELNKNTKRPMQDDFQTYESWLKSFSGPNLRWEILGSIFAVLTSAIICLPEKDGFFSTQNNPRNEKQRFAMEMKDCIQACITLSSYMDFINMQMVALLAKNLIISTVLSGDTSESILVLSDLGYETKCSDRFTCLATAWGSGKF